MKHAVRKRTASGLRKLAVLLCCWLAVFTAKAQPAIAGYTGLGTFNGHYYYISQAFYYGKDISVGVADARAKILAIEPSRPGSQVYAAAVLNLAENTFIQNAVIAYNISKYGGNGKSAGQVWKDTRNPWIGLTDAGSEGTFNWSNSQPNCEDFRNWNTGEPNNYSSTFSNGEDYTQMLIMSPYLLNGNPNHDPLGKWNDWFNERIIDIDASDLGPTQLPIVIEVGPAECPKLNVGLISSTNIKCYGEDNGTATFAITSGLAPFTYKLDSDEESATFTNTTFTITDLETGAHTVTVKDANGNTKTINFSISQPAAPLDAVASTTVNVKCNGGNTGSVTISATGGTAPYSGTGTFTGLIAGTYTYTVTDFNGCKDEVTVTIGEPGKILLEAVDKKPACNGNTGSVTINATGGTPPYMGTGVKSGLAPGSYTFTVTDANGCSQSINVTIDGAGNGGFNVAPETFPNRFNSYFVTSLNGATFTGSTGQWTVNSNAYATNVVTTPYYSPSSSYALKVVNFKTTNCGAGYTRASSPKLNAVGACCPGELKLNFTLWTYEVVANDTKARLEIDFSADGGTTWTEVWSKTSAQLFAAYGDNGKTEVYIPIALAYQTANFRYRIRGEMDANDCNNMYLFIDDVELYSPAVCTPPSAIGDYVWNDLNGNGKQDNGEPGIANASVKLTLPDNSTQTTTTNSQGKYSFTGLAAGTYTVTFTTPSGYVATLSNQGADDNIDSDPVSGSVSVVLAAGQTNNSIDAGFRIPACTNTTNHTETFPNKFNTYFNTSLNNASFQGSSGTWTVSSNSKATMVVTTPYYNPSTSYALKVVNYKTSGCGSGWNKAVSPKVDLSAPCCPSELKMTFTLWTYKVVCNDTKARLEIDFSNNNGSTWTEVWSKTSAQLYSSYGAYGKTMITISVPTSYQNSNFRYRIRGEMEANDCNNMYLFIDDIKIGSPAGCNMGSRSMDNSITKGETVLPTMGEAERGKQPEALVEEKADFAVKVFPNPAAAEFEVRLTSKETAPVTVKVVDMLGRIVKFVRTAPNQSIRFGLELRGGSYVAEITQGERKETVKLVKL